MDIRLELTYATRYQMRRMYRMVMEKDDDSGLDDIFPTLQDEIAEFIIPPSEVMQIMVQYRAQTEKIPKKLRSLAIQYHNALGSNKGNAQDDKAAKYLQRNTHSQYIADLLSLSS